MITFEPLGAEIRIVIPAAVGAVVHGRVRLFLSDNADGYAAIAGEGTRLGAGQPEPVTIYYAVGLGDAMIERLAGMILANSKPAAHYIGLPKGTSGGSPGRDGKPGSLGEFRLTASRVRAAPPRSSARDPREVSTRA